MKRKLFIAVLTALLSLPVLAKKSISVVCGDLSVIKNPDITATVIFDYTDLEIEGKPYMEHLESRGSDFVEDWPQESANSEIYFIKCWNKDNDEGMQVTKSKGKEYKMVFVVKEMHMGSGAASMLVGFGAGGASMSGMMYVMKGDSDVPVLSVEIDGQSGRSGMTEIARRIDLYGELAEDLAETLQKAKQSKVPESTEAVSIPALKLGGGAAAATAKTAAKATAKTAAKATATAATSKKSTAKAKTTAKKAAKAVAEPSGTELDILANAKGEIIPRRRKPVLGDFENIAGESRIGVYLDFSRAEILNRDEAGFVRYMQVSADDRDLDENFDERWENDIKPELVSLFCADTNEELKDNDLGLRFVDGVDHDYVLKMEVLEMDDDANNTINFLFVNMKTGDVEAQIKCESSGGHFGKYLGLMRQGMADAAKNFSEILLDKID